MVYLPLMLALLVAHPQTVTVGAAASEGSSGLVVSSYYWGRIDKTVVGPPLVGPSRGLGRVRRDRRRAGPDPVVFTKRETYALVRNTGGRTIKAVTWDYVFYEDAKHEREVGRFQFRTKEKLEPGEMKFLTAYVEKEAPTSFGAVFIERVEFEDGTVWQRGPA